MRRWILLMVLCAFSDVSATGRCAPIDGLSPLLTPGTVLLLGELHGTVESPAFALDVACHAARRELPVLIGLELSAADQQRVEAFLDSDGSADARTELLSGRRWQSSYQDGRNSNAMLELIDGVRLRTGGADARIGLFDASGRSGGQIRDRAMATNLASLLGAHPEAFVTILTGNIHSRITRGSHRDPRFEPMGHVLKSLVPSRRYVALDVSHSGGSAWICAPDCGRVDGLGGRETGVSRSIEIDEATRPAGHDGWYHVGPITASLPAVSRVLSPRSSDVSSTTPTESSSPKAETPPIIPATEPNAAAKAIVARLQGRWQAYDYGTPSSVWTIAFDGVNFSAEIGPDDWYKGNIRIDPDRSPAQLDLTIKDCRCGYKGQTSRAIFREEGESFVLAAPTPGKVRPRRFNRTNGEMVELRRIGSTYDGPRE